MRWNHVVGTLAIGLSIIAVGVLPGCGGGDKSTSTGDAPEDQLAVRVEDYTITKAYLYDMISKLPEQQRRKYDTHEGRAELARRIIQDELFYREAERLGMAETPAVKAQVQEATRRILTAAFYTEHVEAAARPTEQEIHDYYDAHHDIYTTLAIARAQHIFSKSKSKLDDIRTQIVEGGERFTTMAHRYSEDKLTQRDGGDLGYFNPGGYVRSVGYEKAFVDTLFTFELGTVYGPIKWSQGYSLVRINELRPAELKPYAEVRDEIERVLIEARVDEITADFAKKLAGTYSTHNYMQEYYETVQRSPQELFTYAQAAETGVKKIEAYQEILDRFPNDVLAPKAMFMIGFVYAEELKDFSMADRSFTRVVDQWPDSEIADQARWMLDNMGKSSPEFEDAADKVLNSN